MTRRPVGPRGSRGDRSAGIARCLRGEPSGKPRVHPGGDADATRTLPSRWRTRPRSPPRPSRLRVRRLRLLWARPRLRRDLRPLPRLVLLGLRPPPRLCLLPRLHLPPPRWPDLRRRLRRRRFPQHHPLRHRRRPPLLLLLRRLPRLPPPPRPPRPPRAQPDRRRSLLSRSGTGTGLRCGGRTRARRRKRLPARRLRPRSRYSSPVCLHGRS